MSARVFSRSIGVRLCSFRERTGQAGVYWYDIVAMKQELFLEDLQPGQRFGSQTLQVTAEAITAFAAAYDPQPFHLDDQLAQQTLFAGLSASGWHTAALTMRLLVSSDFNPAGGLIGAGLESLQWPQPCRPGDELHLRIDIVKVRASRSKPWQGIVTIRVQTLNQREQPVQIYTANIVVQARAQQA